jgi:hypothetical protein
VTYFVEIDLNDQQDKRVKLTRNKQEWKDEILSSRSNKYENGCLLGCCTMYSAVLPMMEAVSSSEMSVTVYQTTRHIPELSHIQEWKYVLH